LDDLLDDFGERAEAGRERARARENARESEIE